jgi:L-rhamnose mutarotase
LPGSDFARVAIGSPEPLADKDLRTRAYAVPVSQCNTYFAEWTALVISPSHALTFETMPRCAFKLRIKQGAIEEYEREHARVWPELLAKLKAVGISDYSIFRRGQDLFLCMRVEDFDRAWKDLDGDPVNQRWQQFMARLFEPVPDLTNGERFAMMKEVFYLE